MLNSLSPVIIGGAFYCLHLFFSVLLYNENIYIVFLIVC